MTKKKTRYNGRNDVTKYPGSSETCQMYAWRGILPFIWKWLIKTIALQFSLSGFRTLELWLVLKKMAVGAKESLKLDFSGCTDFRCCRKNCTAFFVISASPECQPREYSESACTVIKTAHWTLCQSGTPCSLTFQGNDRPRVRGSN